MAVAAAAAGGGDRSAFAKCLPARLQRFRATITTPEQTLQQVVNPPQTNIKSSTYTIAGVDPTTPDIGVVTAALVSSGRFIAASKGAGAHEALLSSTYASRENLKVGSKLDLNGTTFTVVGLVRPPLGGQTADVYISLPQLQVLASQKGSVNVLLVRAENGASVGDVQKQIETLYPRAQVASAKQVADSISGSLVDAASLSKRLGTALAVLAAVAAFLLAVLLTLSSVGKRVRELGTLKALGWTQWLVVRQVMGESLAQGILGGLVGVDPRHRRDGRDRRLRPDADGQLEHGWRRRVLRPRAGHGPHRQRPGCAHGADRGRRVAARDSCSPSSAACSPAAPVHSGPRGSVPPMR